jgi:hypothetical protein
MRATSSTMSLNSPRSARPVTVRWCPTSW